MVGVNSGLNIVKQMVLSFVYCINQGKTSTGKPEKLIFFALSSEVDVHLGLVGLWKMAATTGSFVATSGYAAGVDVADLVDNAVGLALRGAFTVGPVGAEGGLIPPVGVVVLA